MNKSTFLHSNKSNHIHIKTIYPKTRHQTRTRRRSLLCYRTMMKTIALIIIIITAAATLAAAKSTPQLVRLAGTQPNYIYPDAEYCIVPQDNERKAKLKLKWCKDRLQENKRNWIIDGNLWKSAEEPNLCVEVAKVKRDKVLRLNKCRNKGKQKWTFDDAGKKDEIVIKPKKILTSASRTSLTIETKRTGTTTTTVPGRPRREMIFCSSTATRLSIATRRTAPAWDDQSDRRLRILRAIMVPEKAIRTNANCFSFQMSRVSSVCMPCGDIPTTGHCSMP